MVTYHMLNLVTSADLGMPVLKMRQLRNNVR